MHIISIKNLKILLKQTFYFLNKNKLKTINNKKDFIDIITIAFNNVSILKIQYFFIKKNLKDCYEYSIIDNSTKKNVSKLIKEFCKNENIEYVKIPQINITLNPSDSHGLAINWAIKNFIKPRKAKYFGIIDHDIFPIKPTKIINILKKQEIYGHLQIRKAGWYLWAGFCFFNEKFINNKKMNFLPKNGMDSGGGNYNDLYKHLKLEKLYFPYYKIKKIGNNNIKQNDYIEYIGNWMHIINASGWFNNGNEKDKINKKKKIIIKNYKYNET